MKRQQPPLTGKHTRLAHPENLSGLQKHHRGMGIIVIRPPTATATVRTLLDKQNRIKLKLHPLLLHPGMRQINNSDLGMQRLTTQTAVAFTHRSDVQHLPFHRPPVPQPFTRMRYSLGVHPTRFLNKRQRCCGY